jgi:hypothetical protein
MSVNERDLDYESHLDEYRAYLKNDELKDTYWHHRAQQVHALCAIQAIGELKSEIVIVGQKTKNNKAYDQLVHGAALRSKLIWSALRLLVQLAPPNRTEPMSMNDSFEVSRALNDIYIHILGLLDNYAWALVHLSKNEEIEKLNPLSVSLFSDKLMKHRTLLEYNAVLSKYGDWSEQVKTLRNPVAHRIPLSVVHTVLNEQEEKLYNSKYLEWWNESEKLVELIAATAAKIEIEDQSEKVDRLYSALQKIGSFLPAIKHDPAESFVPIYPTVPQDVGVATIIVRKINSIVVK